MTPPPATMVDLTNEVRSGPTASERLIVALDMKDRTTVMTLVHDLGNDVSFYKVGMVRLLDTGIDLVEKLTSRDKKVFLDLKSFDIPETVASTVALAKDKGATFVTVHGSGAAIEAARKEAGDDLKILVVTILTSLSRSDVYEIYGVDYDLEDMAVEMAKRFLEKGCDGVIASPQEAARLRDELKPEVLIVTPGIRLDGTSIDDHQRPGDPRKAIADGADYLVVGRPIYEADDPRAAASDYIAAIQKGLDDRAGAGADDVPPT